MFDEDFLFQDTAPLDVSTALQVAVNTLISSGVNQLSDRISMSGAQAAVPSMMPAALPVFPMIAGAAAGAGAILRGGAAAVMGAGRLAVGILRSAGGRVLGWVLPSGQKVTRKAAVSMAKQFGLIAAATALGATVEDLAQAVLEEESSKTRRSRGITGAQLRITRRTIGKVERAHKQIAQVARKHLR